MTVSAFRTVRARLLALMVLVILPIALITALTATTTYRSVLASIEASQVQTVGNFAVRARIWYRETLRALLVTVAGVTATEQAAADCGTTARRIIDDGIGFSLVAIRIGGQPLCSAAADPAAFDAARIEGVMERFRARPPTGQWAGAPLAEARYGYLSVGGRRHLGVHVRSGPADGAEPVEALILADAGVLDRAFDLGTISPGVIVALVERSGEVVIVRGSSENDHSWLPRRELTGTDITRWSGTSRSGDSAVFASQLIAEPDLYLLARFDQTAERAAFLQFTALLITPLVTLAVLFAAYSLAIDSNIIRWVKGIEGAARARGSNQLKLAPVDPAMPEDIRQVSEAFNALVAEQAERVEKLNLTVGANRHLVRELHHRVKNSLQVVQSYLSLARRQHGPEHRAVLAEVEAKVHVLSIAYRHALAEGEMRPVELKPFLEEVATMLRGLLHEGVPWISVDAAPDIALIVDRAIPLGLLVVEIAGHTLREDRAGRVEVSLAESGGWILLDVRTDAQHSRAAETRIAHGLLRQLEAVPDHGAQGRSLGQWRVPA